MRQSNKFQTGDGFGHFMNQRTGKLTGSRMAAAMSFLKSGAESSERRKLKIEILCERMTGDILQKYQTAEMAWGVEKEPEAKQAFEISTGLMVSDVGFIDHPRIENCGASPDGLVSDKCLIEIKCPSTPKHMEYLLSNAVPEEYKPQMTLQSSCFGGKEVWFVSYDPRLPDKQSLFIKKYVPTPQDIEKVESAAIQFLNEVDEMFEQITQGD